MSENHLETGHGLEASKLLTEIRNTNGMMQDSIGTVIVGIGTPNDANDREIFTVSASDAVNDTKASNSESNNHTTNTFPASITLGGVACVDLIAASNIIDAWLVQQVIQQDEVEVARHSEYIIAPNFHKPACQMAGQAGSGFNNRVNGRRA